MANEHTDKAVKTSSKCFFAQEINDEMGDGTGYYRIVEQDLQSVTYAPEGAVVFSHKDWKEFIKEIKKAKYAFKESDTDDKIKIKLDVEKIKYEKDK